MCSKQHGYTNSRSLGAYLLISAQLIEIHVEHDEIRQGIKPQNVIKLERE